MWSERLCRTVGRGWLLAGAFACEGDGSGAGVTDGTSTSSATGGSTGTPSSGSSGGVTAGTQGSGSSTDTGGSTGAAATTGDACPPKIFDGSLNGSPLVLEGYTEVMGSVEIETGTVDLAGMECLEIIHGGFEVVANDTLESFGGLDRLTSIGGAVRIQDNFALVEFTALENVTTWGSDTGGRITIDDNPRLLNLDGLASLLEAPENLHIENNALLASLSGLESLERVGGTLHISTNASLTGLGALANLAATTYLTINDNDGVSSLQGLESLTMIAWDLQVNQNEQLADVSALLGASVGAPLAQILITGNSVLPQCDAEALADAVRPPNHTGNEDVSGNLGTCP